jgi:hypothetical protein
MIGAGLYLVVGGVYAFMESRLFAADLWPENAPTALKFLLTAQTIIHLSRIVLTWPLYLAEDFLIFLAAFHEANNGDIDDPQ